MLLALLSSWSLIQLGLSTTWQETTIQEGWLTWSHTKNTGKALIPWQRYLSFAEVPPRQKFQSSHHAAHGACPLFWVLRKQDSSELPSQSLRLPSLLFSRLFSYCPLSELRLLINGMAFSLPPSSSASSGELSRFTACWPYCFSLDFQQNCPWASVWINFYILLRLRTGRRDPVSLVYYNACRRSYWNTFAYIETIATWQSF